MNPSILTILLLNEMPNTGTIPSLRLEGRTWRVPRAAIERLAADAMTERQAR